jgi:hypothetical protein
MSTRKPGVQGGRGELLRGVSFPIIPDLRRSVMPVVGDPHSLVGGGEDSPGWRAAIRAYRPGRRHRRRLDLARSTISSPRPLRTAFSM